MDFLLASNHNYSCFKVFFWFYNRNLLY